MPKIVAIISEYNPFHLGHAYQIEKIKGDFGNDTAIIAIMSGNFVQRAETAFADKLVRASAAVDCGVDLVLELPFPFSSASAEFFASAGVSIANDIGVVDHLSFGSELGDCDMLSQIAYNMTTEKFKSALNDAITSKEYDNQGYPALVESVYRNLFAYMGESFTTSNNILAIEYLKALHNINSSISPHTYKRVGSSYNSTYITSEKIQSASAIRESVFQNNISALNFTPDSAKSRYLDALEHGLIPCDYEKLSSAIICFFRLNSTSSHDIHDAEGGLYNRLVKQSYKASSITSLTELAATKKYTLARIKRAILFSFLGVTSSDIREKPHYTQVLAMSSVGAQILKEIKKKGKIKIITKPSVTKNLDDVALSQKRLADAADSIFHITVPRETDGTSHLTFTPYVKK